MLIDSDLVRFCADKTREIVAEYEAAYPPEGTFWRSADELHAVMSAKHGLPIYHRKLTTHWRDAKYRSFYVPYADRYEIYYADGLPAQYLRYYKSKELLQIHLWQESLVTRDIVDLVQNMILRESPASVDLNLGHPATSDTLGEIAAMEFLFPLQRRLSCGKDQDGAAKLAVEYDIPPFVVQRCLNFAEPLKPYFP
jgi:hypothetical protein